MRVRTQKAFSAYIGSQIIPFAAGEEVEGDLALALVQASCAVEVIDDPNGSLSEAAEFHVDGPAAEEPPVVDEPLADLEPAGEQPEPEPGPVPSLVRARSTFSAYDGANVVQFTDGQEVVGDLAALLAAAGCDVEVLATEEPTAAAAPAEPVQTGPVPAGDSADDPAADFVPGPHTVKDVLAYVEANPDQAEAVLAAEKADRARTTLLAGLSDFIAARG